MSEPEAPKTTKTISFIRKFRQRVSVPCSCAGCDEWIDNILVEVRDAGVLGSHLSFSPIPEAATAHTMLREVNYSKDFFLVFCPAHLEDFREVPSETT